MKENRGLRSVLASLHNLLDGEFGAHGLTFREEPKYRHCSRSKREQGFFARHGEALPRDSPKGSRDKAIGRGTGGSDFLRQRFLARVRFIQGKALAALLDKLLTSAFWTGGTGLNSGKRGRAFGKTCPAFAFCAVRAAAQSPVAWQQKTPDPS